MIKKEEKCICDRCGRIIKGGKPRYGYIFRQPVTVKLREQCESESSATIKGFDDSGELSFITEKIEEIKENEIRQAMTMSVEVVVDTSLSTMYHDLCPECYKKLKKFLKNDEYDT